VKEGEPVSGIEVLFYKKANGQVPIKDFLDELVARDRDKCLARLKWLKDRGHEIGPPVSKFLRDGIYELRVTGANRAYRMLYFFFGRQVVVLTHGLIKKTQKVPPREIDKAVQSRREFEKDARGHTFRWEP